MEVSDLKQQIALSDRWMDVLAVVAGIPREHLDGHHHPCPKCGGTDRFRMIDEKAGAVLCNQCFNRENGDGIAAVRWMLGISFPEALERICSHLGIIEDHKPAKLPKSAGKPKKHPEAPPTPDNSDTKLFPIAWVDAFASDFCRNRPPITKDGLIDCGVVMAEHKFGRKEHHVFALPVWGEKLKDNKPVGWAMLPFGLSLPAYKGKGQPIDWVKAKTLYGSKAGWIGQVDRLATATVVWKTEGLKDMLALASQPDLPADHAVITNAFGAKEKPEPWMLDLLAGKKVYVAHDCDRAGQDGAVGWTDEKGRRHAGFCNLAAVKASDVRNIDLGAPIAEDSGYDLKDWLNKGGKIAELIQLAESAEKQQPAADTGPELNVAIDDPHRLAKLNLQQYREGHKRDLVYWNDRWYSWENGAYTEMTERHLRKRINAFIEVEFTRANEEDLARWRKAKKSEVPPEKKKVTAALVNNVYEATGAICQLSSSQEFNQWIGRPKTSDILISVSNGILNVTKLLEIRAGRLNDPIESVLTPHSPQWFSLAKVNYPFNPDACCDYWETWLGDVFNRDCESIDALQLWFGYLLSGRTDLHKLMLLIGKTRSGKGTIAGTMERLFGSSAMVTPTLSDLSERFALESWLGATICNFNDARLSGRSDEAAITERLLSISGGDPQNIQRKNITTMNAVRLKVRFTIFTNLVPKFRDPSAAFLNRCILIYMPNSYLGREDLDVSARIEPEMSGILNWAIRGIELLREAGRINQPASGGPLLREMGSIISTVSQFVGDCCELDPKATVETKELFSAWEHYCRENEIDHPGTPQSFSRKLKATNPQIDTKKSPVQDQSKIRPLYFVGIRLKPEDLAEGF